MLKKLSDIAIITMGQSPASRFYNTQKIGIPFLQGRTTFGDKYPFFDTWSSFWNKEAQENDILFTVRAPVGDLNIANTKIAIGRGIAAIHPISVSTRYLFYLLSTNKDKFLFSSAGTVFDSINKNSLESIELNVHTEQEQLHIVNTIGTIDDLIEKSQKIYDKLIKISVFIFDLYENKNINNFNEIFETFNGGTFQSKYYTDYSQYKLITIKNVDDNGFNTNSTSYLTKEKADNKFLLNIGDIILTMTGNIGRTGIVDENNCYLNQRVLKINSPSKLYLFCYLNKYKNNIIQLGKGTAQLNLALEDLNKLKINNSLKEIIQFKNYDYIFDMMVKYKIKIKKLSKIKADLLSKYF